jgi:hypothetical protein
MPGLPSGIPGTAKPSEFSGGSDKKSLDEFCRDMALEYVSFFANGRVTRLPLW